uniref:hypothetical protein n=1 Tax=Candidatus Cryptobacteroides bacterium TaxID=3085639 RepID=UPI0040291020
MKKILTLLLLLYGTTLMAQNKAVAITEVVDKEDKVPYAVEIMVRTRLTAAISMKQGYNAYDRVDLQTIMSEHNFQRTGLVDDATIKKLGEMTGASLVLIPEVAASDDGKIYVAVKMLDVTTAQTMMSTGQLMGSSSNEVDEGCLLLVEKVLGNGVSTSSISAPTDEPITLYGYLHVFPKDVGEFKALPEQLLSAINNQGQYGYDSWRLPTIEELSIMRANSDLIPNLKNADYLCSDSSNGGYARLVTTDSSVKQRELRKKAIYNLLGTEDCIICDSIAVAAKRVDIMSYLGYQLRSDQYPSLKFHTISQISLIQKYRKLFKIDANFGYLIDEWKEYIGNTTFIHLRFIDSDGKEYKRLLAHDRIEGTMSYTNYINYTGSYLVMLVAELPSEEAIQQEMQRLSKQQ